MAKVTDLGSLPPDDPIFSGGAEMFSPRAFRPSSTSTAPTTDGATPAPSASAGAKLPPPPERQNFKTQEEFEEARGYWQGHVGRIKAMAEREERSKASRGS